MFVVPFVGEIGPVLAGVTALARVALIAGESSGMVYDPASALLRVLGTMFGLGGITKVGGNPKSFQDVAAKRGDLRIDDGSSRIGGNFQKRDDAL